MDAMFELNALGCPRLCLLLYILYNCILYNAHIIYIYVFMYVCMFILYIYVYAHLYGAYNISNMFIIY